MIKLMLLIQSLINTGHAVEVSLSRSCDIGLEEARRGKGWRRVGNKVGQAWKLDNDVASG